MPRYLFNPATNYSTSGGGGVTPILLGGTGATTAAAAATNLGFVKTSDVGAANGVASLDASSKLVASLDWAKISSGKPTTLVGYGITNCVSVSSVGSASGVASLDSGGKVPLAQMPTSLGTSINGPTNVYVNQVVNYTINSYSTFNTYTITTVGGTFTQTNGTIVFTVTASAGGAASITVNGATFTLTVLASSVVAPSVTSPVNAATGITVAPTFTSSAFAYLGMAQTQDSVQWDLATNSNFTTIVQTYTGASNLVSWTPTVLSLNSTYYVRVRHHSSIGGWSAWSGVVSFSTIASYGWAARLASGYTDKFQAVACDTSGNIYAVGSENSQTSGGASFALITKWNSAGALAWQKRVHAVGPDVFYGVVCDSTGNIYAVGTQNTSGSGYALMTKWDTSGNLTWQKKIGNAGGGHSEFFGVTRDTTDNIYAVGYENLTSTYAQAFITKWDTSGNVTWQRNIGNSGTVEKFYGVTCDSIGNIYAVGIETTWTNLLIIKLDASGNVTWQRKIVTSTGVDYFYGVVCDSSGNIYVAGTEQASTGGSVNFITKWDASGNLTWQKKIGSAGTVSSFNGIAIDSSNNIYAAGNGLYTGSNGYTAYITKWDTSGNLTWQRNIGGTNTDFFKGVTCDSSGNIYAVGYEDSSTSAANYEALITKWPSNITGLPNGTLAGTGMTALSIATPTQTADTDTLTVTTPTLPVANPGLTLNTPTYSASPGSLTRYFSSF